MDRLMAALFNRWNNASLDDSIASLYPAGESKSGRNRGGAPAGSDLPRAEYFIVRGAADAKSRNSRVYQAIATVQVWGTTPELVGGYVRQIHDAFVNSDDAASNPMVMTGGDILEVDDGGEMTFKDDDAVHFGEKRLIIRHRINNGTP